MTKLRPVVSIEDALVRISSQVPGGFDAMGECVGRKGGIVRAWGDPDRPELMPVAAIVPLDVLFQEHGGVGSPLFELLEFLRTEAHADRFAGERRLAVATAEVALESGQAVSALIEASLPGASAAAKAKARKEVADLGAAIGRVVPQLAAQEAPP